MKSIMRFNTSENIVEGSKIPKNFMAVFEWGERQERGKHGGFLDKNDKLPWMIFW